MKNILKFIMMAGTIVLLSACGEPTYDTSSKDAMNESAKKIMAELNDDDKKKFMQAVQTIYFVGAIINDKNDETIKKIEEKLNGKTGKEIISLSEDLKKGLDKK